MNEDKLLTILNAVDDVAKAYVNTAFNKVSEEEINYRKSKCESCVLFDGRTCNNNHLGSLDNKIITLDEAKRMMHTKVNGVIKTAIDSENRIYYRGCGCTMAGDSAKYKFYFSKEDLSKRDGTGPCPMGKWLKD